MCRFIETIRLEHGRILYAGYHNRRLNATRRAWWGEMADLHVEDYIVPEYTERTRCRIVYGREIESVEYFAYQPRQVCRLRLLACDTIEYRYKQADRSLLDQLYALRGEADDVLIVRDGLITDTSIANVALWDGRRWDTPARPLLAGTHRQRLLDQGIIQERDIRVADLPAYRKICLFNAMLDFEEVVTDVSRILIPPAHNC